MTKNITIVLLLCSQLSYGSSCGANGSDCDMTNTTGDVANCVELKGGIQDPNPMAGVNNFCRTNTPFTPYACVTEPLCLPAQGGYGSCRIDFDCATTSCGRRNGPYYCAINSGTGWGCCAPGTGSSSSSSSSIDSNCMGHGYCEHQSDCAVGQDCCTGTCVASGCFSCGCNS